MSKKVSYAKFSSFIADKYEILLIVNQQSDRAAFLICKTIHDTPVYVCFVIPEDVTLIVPRSELKDKPFCKIISADETSPYEEAICEVQKQLRETGIEYGISILTLKRLVVSYNDICISYNLAQVDKDEVREILFTPLLTLSFEAISKQQNLHSVLSDIKLDLKEDPNKISISTCKEYSDHYDDYKKLVKRLDKKYKALEGLLEDFEDINKEEYDTFIINKTTNEIIKSLNMDENNLTKNEEVLLSIIGSLSSYVQKELHKTEKEKENKKALKKEIRTLLTL